MTFTSIVSCMRCLGLVQKLAQSNRPIWKTCWAILKSIWTIDKRSILRLNVFHFLNTMIIFRFCVFGNKLIRMSKRIIWTVCGLSWKKCKKMNGKKRIFHAITQSLRRLLLTLFHTICQGLFLRSKIYYKNILALCYLHLTLKILNIHCLVLCFVFLITPIVQKM